jgi:hypothetical protein
MGEKYLITMSLMFLTLVPLILLKVLFKFLQKLMQYELKLRPLKSEKIQVLLVISGVIAPRIGAADAGTAHAESSSGLEATDRDGAHSVGEPHAVAASESTPSPLDQSHQATTTC